MAWPEETTDTVLYEEKELIADKNLTLRMIDGAKVEFIGEVDIFSDVDITGDLLVNGDTVLNGDLEITGAFKVNDLEIDGALNHDGSTVGFYGTTPVAKPTGVTPGKALETLGLGASLSYTVNVKDFGAVGDGVANDTTAIQNWLTYISTNHRHGWMPKGNYLITSTLVVADACRNWTMEGEGPSGAEGTCILQATDNIPILQLGTVLNSPIMHTHTIKGINFAFVNVQPITNTNAICIEFWANMYWCRYEWLYFGRCFYAMKTHAGTSSPWGCSFDDLVFGGEITGGAYDEIGTLGGGPGNVWGRSTFDCTNMVGPVFRAKWQDSRIDSMEFLVANKGPILMYLFAGSRISIGSLKLENCIYTASIMGAFFIEQSSQIDIDTVFIGGNAVHINPPGGSPMWSLFYVQDGGYGTAVNIGHVNCETPTTSSAGDPQPYVAEVGEGSLLRITSLFLHPGWFVAPRWWSGAQNNIVVENHITGQLSSDKGDADYVVAVGDPNRVQFRTPFTASRTITIPNKDSNYIASGLYYTLTFRGAINGANTAIIKEGSGTTLDTLTADCTVTYAWRRAEWIRTSLNLETIVFPPAAPVRRTIKAVTATTYAPVLVDENQMITLSNAATITVTMPSNGTQAFPIGSEIEFLWYGVGQPVFAAGGGATVVSRSGFLKASIRYGKVTAKKTNTSEWLLSGDLVA